jgi:5'-nucleotidase (lipoprotein e(P4) family)
LTGFGNETTDLGSRGRGSRLPLGSERSGVGSRSLAWMLWLAVLLTSCQTPTAIDGSSNEGLDSVLWMRTSAEYYALTEQAYRLAALQVDQALRPENAAWTAAIEQTSDFEHLPLAAILDVDEVVLDTLSFQAGLVKQGEPFGVSSWGDWVRKENAPAIPGAVEFAKYARERGIEIFYVTNRDSELEEPTLRNLRTLGFSVDADGANLLSKGERAGWGSDKASRRQFIANTHRVVLIIGDDLNDFVSGSRTTSQARVSLAQRWQSHWGTRWIVTPNSVYGGWERSLYDFDGSVPRPLKLRIKYDALEPDHSE